MDAHGTMTIPTSPGKLVAILCLAAGIAKLFGIVAVKFPAADLFLAGLLASAVLP